MAGHHQNPYLSVFIGTIIGTIKYLKNIQEHSFELLKLIIFAMIGGFAGYLGKKLAENMHKRYDKWRS